MGDRQEVEGDDDLKEVRDMLRRPRGEIEKPARDGRREVIASDWTCQTVACKGWSNFNWRTCCMKCGRVQAEN